jgi:hypothetical protein
MVFFTLETGTFGLISEGQMMAGVRKKHFLKTFCPWKFLGAKINFKKYPVSANVKKTVFIR